MSKLFRILLVVALPLLAACGEKSNPTKSDPNIIVCGGAGPEIQTVILASSANHDVRVGGAKITSPKGVATTEYGGYAYVPLDLSADATPITIEAKGYTTKTMSLKNPGHDYVDIALVPAS